MINKKIDPIPESPSNLVSPEILQPLYSKPFQSDMIECTNNYDKFYPSQ